MRIETPLTKEKIKALSAGDKVLLTGTVYTARDAAHKRLTEMKKKGEPLPFEIENAVIYYTGPTPARPGEVIGSAGPTTSYRMDAYAPELMDMGQSAMIGKGPRNDEVKAAMVRNGAVYFAAIGGAGAVMAGCVKNAEIIAFEDLGPEAIRKLEVEDMPLIVAIDSEGRDLYRKEGR